MVRSIPPVPTASILRWPGDEGIATWGAVTRWLGYHTRSPYGGYGYFHNMKCLGVSDEDLFSRTQVKPRRVGTLMRPIDVAPDADPARLGVAYFQTAYELFAAHRYRLSDAQQPAPRPSAGNGGN